MIFLQHFTKAIGAVINLAGFKLYRFEYCEYLSLCILHLVW